MAFVPPFVVPLPFDVVPPSATADELAPPVVEVPPAGDAFEDTLVDPPTFDA
jgi:hypothetical protein